MIKKTLIIYTAIIIFNILVYLGIIYTIYNLLLQDNLP